MTKCNNIKSILLISLILTLIHMILSISEFFYLLNTVKAEEGWVMLLFIFLIPYFIFVLIAIISTSFSLAKLKKYFVLLIVISYIIAIPLFFLIYYVGTSAIDWNLFKTSIVYFASLMPFTFFSAILILPATILSIIAFIKLTKKLPISE